MLTGFGLQYVRTALYKPGKALEEVRKEQTYSVTNTDRGTPNMHTNRVPGEDLRPGVTGEPISALGTPIWSDVILHKQEEELLEGVQLISCLITVQQAKNIVKTAIQGRPGTVKEFISDGDYQVTLRGAVTRNFKNEYPLEELRRFLQLLKDSRPLKVISPYLLQFDIHELVVETYTMGQEQGKQNVQTFEVVCSSDTPLLLKEMDNANS